MSSPIDHFDVLMDLNDTFWRTRRAARKAFERLTGFVCPEDMHFRKTTIIGRVLRRTRGKPEQVTAEVFNCAMDQFYAKGGFAGKIDVMPYALSVCRQFQRARYRVGIVTDSETMPHELVQQELICQGLGDVPVFFTREGGSGENGKAPYYSRAKRLVIDDKLSHLRETRDYCLSEGLPVPKLLLMESMRPEAQNLDPREGIQRVGGWNEIWRHLEERAPRRIAA